MVARPATWRYVAGRFVRRNRAGVATAAAVFAITVAGFVLALGWSAARARHERDAAERVTSMLIQMFSGSDPRTPRGETVTARELLDRGTDGIRRELGDQPDVQARLLDAVGAIYSGLGLPERALAVGHDAPSAWRGTGVADSVPAAFAMSQLADSLRQRGQLAAAEPLARRAYDMTRRLMGAGNPQTGVALNVLANILYTRGRLEEAEAILLDATEIFRDSLGPQHPMVGTVLHSLAIIRRDRGDAAGAERLLREALVIQRSIQGQVALDNFPILADIVDRAGRQDEAERILRDDVGSCGRRSTPDRRPAHAARRSAAPPRARRRRRTAVRRSPRDRRSACQLTTTAGMTQVRPHGRPKGLHYNDFPHRPAPPAPPAPPALPAPVR